MAAKTKKDKTDVMAEEFFKFLQDGGLAVAISQPPISAEETKPWGEFSNLHTRVFEKEGKLYRASVFKYVKPPVEDIRVGDCAVHLKQLQQGEPGMLKKLFGGGKGDIKLVLAPEEIDKLVGDDLKVKKVDTIKAAFEFMIGKL